MMQTAVMRTKIEVPIWILIHIQYADKFKHDQSGTRGESLNMGHILPHISCTSGDFVQSSRYCILTGRYSAIIVDNTLANDRSRDSHSTASTQ